MYICIVVRWHVCTRINKKKMKHIIKKDPKVHNDDEKEILSDDEA
jgi:hypothetical protein